MTDGQKPPIWRLWKKGIAEGGEFAESALRGEDTAHLRGSPSSQIYQSSWVKLAKVKRLLPSRCAL